MYLEDRDADSPDAMQHVRGVVGAARLVQRRIERVGPVGGREHDDSFARVEAVHLGQDMVQRLLALVVAPNRRPAPAGPAEGVQLVDEDGRRRGLGGLLEEVAHARRAHADDHLDELRGAQAEEGDASLAGDRAGEEGLPRAGGPTSSTPFGTVPPSRWYFAGFFRKSTISTSSFSASSM